MTSRRRFQLNPAFAAAHSLNETSESSAGSAGSSKRVDLIISQARKTGKVQASNANLTSLDALLEWPAVAVNLSLDASSSTSYQHQHVVQSVISVDVSDNALYDNAFKDDRFAQQFKSLQILRAKRSQLVGVLQLQSLANLVTLDLSGNQLTTFSLAKSTSSNLRTLDLSSNALTDLGNDGTAAVDLPHLINLNISENKLTNVPNLKSPQLQTLSCGNNQLTTLDFLAKCQCLETLNAPNNRITALPDHSSNDASFYKAPIVTLNLANNRLKTISNLPSTLVRLVLNENSLTAVHGIGNSNATSLIDVLLGGNQLTEIPDGLVDCQQLKVLDIQSNRLQNLPHQLGSLSQLQTLLVQGNPLARLRASISDWNDTAAILRVLRKRAPTEEVASKTKSTSNLTNFLVGTKTLSFESKKLTELPSDVLSDLKQQQQVSARVERLMVTQNQLTSISDEWIEVLGENLKIIEATKNQLVEFPNVGPKTRLLMELHLGCNRLPNIQLLPSSLQFLQILDLSWNRPIDKAFCCHTLPSSLRVLKLAGNKLTGVNLVPLPVSLEVLDLSDNHLPTLGDEFPLDLVANCRNLNTLLFQNNDLQVIPLELGLLLKNNVNNTTSLTHLDLRGNSQRGIRYAILEKQCLDLLQYLQDRMTPAQLAKAKEQVEQRRSSGTTSNHAPSQQPSATESSVQEIAAAVPLDKQKNSDLTPIVPSKETLPPKTTSAVQQVVVSVEEAKKPEPKEEQRQQQQQQTTEEVTKPNEDSLVDELRESVNALTIELKKNRSMSQAKLFAVKKQLAMARSKLIREERRIKQLAES